MQQIIVSDASCLILLDKLGELNLLNKIFGQILITETVAVEFKKKLPNWILVKYPSPDLYLRRKDFLDPGEASSIGLAASFDNALLIIDEGKGRKIAKELGLSITGSLGIILLAKKKGLVPLVRPIIEKIQRTNFRLSEALIEKVLELAEEG